MNELIIAGKVIGNVDVKQSENGTTYGQLLLTVKRAYKNKDGNTDSDVFQVTMFKNCIENTKDKLSDGTAVIIKGHTSANNYVKDGKTIYNSSIIADYVNPIDNLI